MSGRSISRVFASAGPRGMGRPFAASRESDVLTMDMFDVVGEDYWGEGISSKAVNKALTSNPDAKTIRIRLNSPGGDALEGNAIYSLLRGHGAKVEVEVHGLAASAASIIAMAGDDVRMAPNAMMMVHDPWLIVRGNSSDLREVADVLDKIRGTLLGVYVKATGLKESEVSDMMLAETWLTATEAVDKGFATEVIDEGDAREHAAKAVLPDRVFATLRRFKHTPNSWLQGEDAPHRVAASTRGETPSKDDTMDKKELLALLGLPEDASDDTIKAAAAKLREPAPAPSLDNVVPRADYDALKAKWDKEQSDKKAKAEADFSAAATRAVEDACRAGRITPAAKDYHLSTINSSKDIEERMAALKRFESYAAAQPEMVSDDQGKRAEQTHGGNAPGSGPSSAVEAEVCKLLGVSAEEMAKAKADMREDPNTYPPEAYRFAM